MIIFHTENSLSMMIVNTGLLILPLVFSVCQAFAVVAPNKIPYQVPTFPHGQAGSNPYCFDNITDCSAYIEHDATICNPSSRYYPWVTTHCQASCSVCQGGPTTTPQPCVDALDYCDQFKIPSDCQQYAHWAKKNCIKTCGLCNGITAQPPAVG